MNISTVREKEIDMYIRDHPEAEIKEQKVPVELAGEVEYLPVWKIPLTSLVFNIRNGRFASELLAKEKELSRKLDPTVREDSLIIRQLLLDQSKDETEALKENLSEYSQLEPGIITFDGAIINANRRAAILGVLFEDTREQKFSYLKVGRLRKNVDEKDLWRIEAGLQFAKDFKLEYGPVNELLKLKEGITRGLDAKDISKSLLGRYSKKKVDEKLKVLKLIESYLDFIEKPKQYYVVQDERSVEKFNSLQSNVVSALEREGVSHSELTKLITVAFSLIESGGVTHWDIRKLKEIAMQEDAKEELLRPYNLESPRSTTQEALIDSFETAKEMVDDKAEEEKPERLLKRALSALKAINRKSAKLKEANVKTLLSQLETELKKLLKTT